MRDRKMNKEKIKKHVDRAMESIRQEPFVQKYMANEPKCLKCGKRVWRQWSRRFRKIAERNRRRSLANYIINRWKERVSFLL